MHNEGTISLGNYDGIKFTQGSLGETLLGSVKLVYRTTGNPDMSFSLRDASDVLYLRAGGNVGMGNSDPSHPLHMASGAHVTASGVWTDASSRDYKENIQDLKSNDALATLRALEPKQFNYRVDPDETFLGFIAEDAQDLVATAERNGLSPMDFVAVLTKVVQDQQKKIEKLEANRTDSPI